MADNDTRLGGYFVTEGWLLIVVVLIIIVLFLTGVIDVFFSSFSTCKIGDGLVCTNHQFFTDEKYGLSDGSSGDGMSAVIRNELSLPITDLTLSYAICKNGIQTKTNYIINPGESIFINTTDCSDMPTGVFTKSSLIIMYNVVFNETKVGVVQYGLISGIVKTTDLEKPYERIAKAVSDWFKHNVG